MGSILRKDELEVQLKEEHKLIQDGVIRDESPLDLTPVFRRLCDACRVGDLKACHEALADGANINARDQFDYTPLILASLCGHYDLVQFLLESGALCERDTFQGERCIYNALNNRIRNLLLQYDYSKSTDPLQPFASHITSLLTNQIPKTSDITLTAGSETWHLHKAILSARSPYFSKKLAAAPDTTSWKLANTIPAEAFHVTIRYLYLDDIPADLGLSLESFVTEEEVFMGIDKISQQLELKSLVEGILAGKDRRLARQRHQDETNRGRDQIDRWYRDHILKHKMEVDSSRVGEVKWDRSNQMFADVLLSADEPQESPKSGAQTPQATFDDAPLSFTGIPVEPSSTSSTLSPPSKPRKTILFPAHKAMLLRSEYFKTMFSSSFKEAQEHEYLQVVHVECTPEVLKIVLDFLYTETVQIPIQQATDVLYAADMLFIEALKSKAATVISTVGMGSQNLADRTHIQEGEEVQVEEELINVYDVIHAAWLLKIQKLEEFCAKYLAYRLESYIDEEEFEELILESAGRIEQRQETDSIELLDDIRYYLNDRFRLRMEDTKLEEIMDEEEAIAQSQSDQIIERLDYSSQFAARTTTLNSSHIPEPNDTMHISTSTPPLPDRESVKETKFGEERGDGEKKTLIRALNGEVVDDEFLADALNYEFLMEKIDLLLSKLKLDA